MKRYGGCNGHRQAHTLKDKAILTMKTSLSALSSTPLAARHIPSNYKPVGYWSGRLIFDRDNRLPQGSVLIEIHNAPLKHSELLGRQVELGWALEGNQELQAYVDFLTIDVEFTEETHTSSKDHGRIHPTRLNGLKRVGPLESLAGARALNNIHATLESGSVESVSIAGGDKKKQVVLRINKPPIQIRGQKRCLATFVGRSTTQKDQLYEIVHYNPTSKRFDGERETILIPTFRNNDRGLQASTACQIEKSPVNTDGWYLYGYYDLHHQIFVVEAWEPRRALIVSDHNNKKSYDNSAKDPQHHVVISGKGIEETVDALSNRIWADTRYKKGVIESFLLDPTTPKAKTTSTKGVNAMLSDDDDWKEGDTCLVIHLFGGIGGFVVNEDNFLGLIPGHFAFGNASVVRDDFTNELQFRIIYRQVYAHNNGGIISGPNMWSSYCGDLQRGWLGTRPISDIIVKLDFISRTYTFGDGVKICPMNELVRELNEMCARYRTGDGDGCALVSPAHSCVQDSNQALYAALEETYRKFNGNPIIEKWKKSNPTHEQTRDMAKLEALYKDVDKYITPFGIRKDWRETSKGLHGTTKKNHRSIFGTFIETIRTWGTVVPRRAHDRLAEILLRHGAKLWFIRTNQVGGNNPQIIPLAPATAFDYQDNRKDPVKEDYTGATYYDCCSGWGCFDSSGKVADNITKRDSTKVLSSSVHEGRRGSF